jgi:hypothetical protein
MAKKGDFGGYRISFTGCLDRMEDVFGKEKLTPGAMTKKLWAYVKSKGLEIRPAK